MPNVPAEVLERIHQNLETVKTRVDELHDQVVGSRPTKTVFSLWEFIEKRLPDAAFQAILTVALAYLLKFLFFS